MNGFLKTSFRMKHFVALQHTCTLLFHCLSHSDASVDLDLDLVLITFIKLNSLLVLY